MFSGLPVPAATITGWALGMVLDVTGHVLIQDFKVK
jgi:hypothetical protein